MINLIQSNFTFVITSITLLSNVVFVVILFLILFDKRFKKLAYSIVNRHILSFLFVVSFGALVASLTYSEVMNFLPCELCWISRIFMYPQAILTFMAMRRKDKNIVEYLLPLSILGAIVSFYHSLVHWGLGVGVLPCTAVGAECYKVYVLEYGYITIPFMAFTSFVYLIFISILYFKSKNAQ